MKNEDEIGLVLSGGGAKGAFQAGVWKAMDELGLAKRVRVISGTSVGTLNAAAFAALRDPDEICRFWRTKIGDIATVNLDNLSPQTFFSSMRDLGSGKPFPFRGLLNCNVLEGMMGNLLPAKWPEDAPDVFATTLECRSGVLNTFNRKYYEKQCFFLNEEQDAGKRIKRMLASAAIPWGFDAVEIDGRRYIDGGWEAMGGDNIPVAPIFRRHPGIRTIIVVRCNCAADEPERIDKSVAEGVEIVEVRPAHSLRGPLDVAENLLSCVNIPKGISIIGSIGQGVEFLARQIRIWSGTLAFNRDYVDKFITQGYIAGMTALKQLKPKARLNW